jgi:hypothetical protein
MHKEIVFGKYDFIVFNSVRKVVRLVASEGCRENFSVSVFYTVCCNNLVSGKLILYTEREKEGILKINASSVGLISATLDIKLSKK